MKITVGQLRKLIAEGEFGPDLVLDLHSMSVSEVLFKIADALIEIYDKNKESEEKYRHRNKPLRPEQTAVRDSYDEYHIKAIKMISELAVKLNDLADATLLPIDYAERGESKKGEN